MRGWVDDLVYAGRRLIRSPGFSLTALTILVLGIGVNSTAFGVVNALLFQRPPFEATERIVMVFQDSDGGTPSSTSYPAFLDMARMTDVFTVASAFNTSRGFLEQGEGLVSVNVEYATSAYMDVIGLHPSRGVWFDASADDPSGPPQAVITHHMWANRLASDPAILGSTLRISGGLVTVIGVGPAEFNGGSGPLAMDLWLSISAMAVTGGQAASLTRRQDHPFAVRALLASGVSVERAAAAMDGLADDLARTYPDINSGRRISVFPVAGVRISPEADATLVPAAAFAMGVVLLVLLIGTLNLANLLLVRSTARAREISVRLALGAGRTRVIRVVFAEAMLLAAIGGSAGLGVAHLSAAALRNARFDFGLPLLIDLRLDLKVFLFTLSVSILAGFAFGFLPALRATRRDVNLSIRGEGSAGLGARRRFGLTGALVAGQVAVSLLLLAVAGTFLDSLARAQGAEPGFDWESTAFVQLNVSRLELPSEAATLMNEQIADRLQAIPGIGRVTTSLMLPAAQLGTTTLLLGAGIDGVDSPSEIPWNYVSANFFDVMDVPLLHGRLLEASDLTGPTVAVVSEAFGRTYWGRADVVGETYRSEGQPDQRLEIVGVVGNVPVRSLGEAPTPSIYWPLNFAYPRTNFLFEIEGSGSAVIASVRAAIVEIDPRIMLLSAGTMADHLGDTLERQRLIGALLGALGAMALGLALLGIYGVVSFAVSRRRREIGIRMALGAGGDSVIRLFVRDVSMVVVAGAAVGILLSIPVGGMTRQLFTGGEANPAMTGGLAVLFLITALIATVLPARRAARTDPTEALRQE